MCFSAPASFTAAAVLAAAGSRAAWCAWKRDRRFVPLALTPVLFGVQQLAEGVVWLGLGRDDPSLVRTASQAYLFFALAFWPLWFPICAASLDDRPVARRVYLAGAVASLGWFCFLVLPLWLEPARYLTVRVTHHSIEYDYSSLPVIRAVPLELLRGLYMIMGGVPLVTSSARAARTFGLLLAGAALLSRVVYAHAFASVWCFLAAVLALYLCLALSREGPPGRPHSR